MNTKANKKNIRLTESQLETLIETAVRKTLNSISRKNKEKETNKEGIDITKIDIETLKQAYRDLSLTPIHVNYDNILSLPTLIKEAYGDPLPPDSVVNQIANKYKFSTKLVSKVEAENRISIYIIVALIGQNIQLIKTDMEKMGYFLGHIGNQTTVQGMTFVQLQFEPYCQMQIDETDNIKSQYNTLYHWTPDYNLKTILSEGLKPSHKNTEFNYPPRTYLMKGNSTDNEILSLGQNLSLFNKNPNNNGHYTLLEIDITNINDNIRFYYDPNSSIGIYTEQPIPPTNIKPINNIMFSTKLK